jgi:starvation-inducible outer membrane lipoprotein
LKSKLSKKEVGRRWQVLDIKNRALLTACFMLVSCSVYPSTLKIEAIYSAEASLDFASQKTELFTNIGVRTSKSVIRTRLV